jgi:hypothetical protein
VLHDPQDVAEAQRRRQLDVGWRGVLRADLERDVLGVDEQDSPTMRLALWRLMVGSHAYRRPLEY